ncbi:MAG: hypothetical protein ACWA5W_03200 [Phycisphaerales bacterium]
MSKPTGISGRMIGLMGAAVLAVIFVIIVGISISRAPKPTGTGEDLFGADPSEIPDITETQTGGAMLVTMVDKNDSSRVAATLKADRFEPIGEGQRRLDRPVSWIYMKDGRAIEVTADYATMLMPDPNEPPESGTLEGHIQIRAYEDPNDLSTPSLVALFDEPVEFERRYLRLRSEGHFKITSDRFDFAGTDLTVILNELRDRVELLEVVKGDRLVIHPGKPKASSAPADALASQSQPKRSQEMPESSSQVAQGDSTEPSNEMASAKANEQTDAKAKDNALPAGMNRYHVTIADQVVVSALGVDEQADEELGRVSADQLELWALLDGSQLAPDAITPIRFVPRQNPKNPNNRSQPKASTPKKSSPTTSTPVRPTRSTPGDQVAGDQGDVVLTWAGKLVLKPMADDEVGELGNDALAIALTTSPDADEHAGVVFESPERGFTGQSNTIRYWATRGKVRLESIETPGGIIKLSVQDAGELFATTLDADLTTGEMILAGRGSMKTVQRNDQPDSKTAAIQWTKRARIVFDHDADGISDRLALADFDGAVVAKQFDSLAGEKSGSNRLGALRMVARFDPTKPAAASLEHLTLTKGVLNSESRSMLTGSRIDVDFAPLDDESGVWVDRLVADGEVFARDGESLLKTDHLVADMMQELDGRTVMSLAVAEGSVDFRGKDQSSANAQRMRMEGASQRVVLSGSPAQVGQGVSKILGKTIVLNGDRRMIEVNGPGSFEHEVVEQRAGNEQGGGAASVGHIRVSWKGSMRFDDAIGKLVCNDQVRMVSTPDALSRDTLEANRAQIKLSARPSDDPIVRTNQQGENSNASSKQSVGGDPWAGGLGDGDRVLEWARFSGHAPVGSEPEPVKIESRFSRYHTEADLLAGVATTGFSR